MTEIYRPTVAEIDLDVFAANVAAVKAILPEHSRLVAVLKADGYGHGAVELARRCQGDVAMMATALLEEALELRTAGITIPLLVLGPVVDPAHVALAVANDIVLGITGPEELEVVCAAAREGDVRVHLKLDSGMGRMGFLATDLSAAIERIRATPRLRIEGIYTHFAKAEEEDDNFTEIQVRHYDAMLATLRDGGIDAPSHHFANSAAALRGLVRPGDLARVGIALYGPSPIDAGGRTIEPVMRWRTEIVRLKRLPAGHAIGYGTTFWTQHDTRVATIPVGYADGYSRAMSNTGEVLVRGQRCPIIGRVSMDLVTIDVTDIDGVSAGDEVVLLGASGADRITAEEIAAWTDTISYEVFCRVTARVPRLYREGGAARMHARFSE